MDFPKYDEEPNHPAHPLKLDKLGFLQMQND